MPNSIISKHAQVLINYSLSIQPGETLFILTSSLAHELNEAVYKEALRAGALPTINIEMPTEQEILFKYGAKDQIEYVQPLMRHVYENIDAFLYIEAPYNTRTLAGVDPARQRQLANAYSELYATWFDRASKLELKWSYTIFPNNAFAQEAGMSLSEYQDFVYGACLLNEPDPVAAWQEEAKRQRRLIRWLSGKKEVVVTGEHVDLTFSIAGRSFEESVGTTNFPNGEIFTTPVEDSVNGWVRYSYPAIQAGHEVEDVELWFEQGKVIKAQASKGEAYLLEMLDTDTGARRLGEWGIGTNYGIQQFTKHMLFDEKIGGTIHFALGNAYPETGGVNKSDIHWDMLVDMAQGEILIDDELFYKDGKFVI